MVDDALETLRLYLGAEAVTRDGDALVVRKDNRDTRILVTTDPAKSQVTLLTDGSFLIWFGGLVYHYTHDGKLCST